MRVKDIMTTPVVAIREDAPVKEAAAILASRGFTGLPVITEDGTPTGIVTEADVVRGRVLPDPRGLIWDRRPPEPEPPRTVAEVMSAPILTFSPGDDVATLARVMIEKRVRCVPITEGSRLVGIVTRRDLLNSIARDDRLIAADVRHRLEIYGGPHRWTVDVHDGRVKVLDRFDNAVDAHVAEVLAAAVPGVAHVEVRSRHQHGADPDAAHDLST